MSEIRAKGFALAGCWEWVEANLSDAEKNQVLERLPEDCRATLPAFDEGTWYPVAWFDAVVASVAEVKGSTPEEHREIVYELIRYMAKRNLSSVMKLLVRFMTPTALVRQLGKFWRKYYDGGPDPVVEVDPAPGVRAAVTLEGFEGVRYNSWMVAAWIAEALALVGVENADVTDARYEPGKMDQSDFRWEISWSD